MKTITYSETISSMRAAINANINYLKNNGNSQIRMKNGMFAGVSGESYRYEFELEYLQDLEINADVEIKVGQRSNSGKVIALAENIVTIALLEHLGDTISAATLIISSYFLLEKLDEHLSDIQAGNTLHTDLSEITFGFKQFNNNVDNAYTIPLSAIGKIDEFQESAIRTSLGSDVTFIWGPPGTGKSATISNLLKELIDRGMSVLLIAHTNAATDGVLETVVELMEEENHPAYRAGEILRIGNSRSVSKKLANKNVLPEVIVAEKARPIRAEIEVLKKEIVHTNTRIDYYSKVQKYYESLTSLQSELKQLEDYRSVITEAAGKTEDKIAALEGTLKSVDHQIAEFQSKGKFSQMLSGTNLQKLSTTKSQLLYDHDSLMVERQKFTSGLTNTRSRIDVLQNDKADLEEKISGLPYPYSAERHKKELKSIKLIADQITALEKTIEGLEEGLFDKAKVIATTLTKSYMHEPIIKRGFDCVILDEASMAPLPAVLSVSGLAKKKVVMVGDFMQLPPIAKHEVDTKNLSDDEAKKEQDLIDTWLKKDIFNIVGIESSVTKGGNPDLWLKMLQRQYRMHPDISEVINKLVYAKNNKKFELDDGKNMHLNGKELLSAQPLRNAHFGVYDTSSIGSVPSKSDSGSTYNLSHALVAVEMAKQAIDAGYDNIGIISSYRAQVNLIQKIIEDVFGKDTNDAKKVEADTVHRFQGGAKQIIIFDVTTPYTNTMYDDGKEDGDDAKLINVAFSRAREKCIILADCKVVKSKHSESSLIRKALELAEARHRPFIDATEVTKEYRADDRTEKFLAELTNTKTIVDDLKDAKLFNELDFYPSFQRDMLSAKSEIIIQSAFLTSYRIDQLMPIFNHVLQKGVRIFIITRVPWEHDGQMQEQAKEGISKLEKAGAVVLPFMGKIHQKFGIIDRQIMWDGSLNILSFRDSKETMRRIVGNATVNQYLEFQKLDKNLGKLGENNLKHCDVCNDPSAWMWTKKGSFGRPWTYCLIGNHSAGKPPKTADDRQVYQASKKANQSKAAEVRSRIKLNSKKELVCPEHNRILVERHGRFGEYWDCPLSKECACSASAAFKKKLLTK